MKLNHFTLLLSAFLCPLLALNQLESLYPIHPLTPQIGNYLQKCSESPSYCDDHHSNITSLYAKIINEHMFLLLHDVAQMILMDSFYFINPNSTTGKKLAHMLAVVSFSQTDIREARRHWSSLNASDLSALRTMVSQKMLTIDDPNVGLTALKEYTSLLASRFGSVLSDNLNIASLGYNLSYAGMNQSISRSPSSEKSEAAIQSLILSEAEGMLHTSHAAKLSDLVIAASDIREFDAKQYFQLSIALAKLGLHELSAQHAMRSVTPWDSPLHRLKATLSLPPIYESLRTLAFVISSFEQQVEDYIRRNTLKSPLVAQICDSFDDTSLVLDSLPLMHLAGYSAPRHEVLFGHSPVALPVLLSELYRSMCSTLPSIPPVKVPEKRRSNKPARVRIGIVSGSFDSLSGKLIIGILDSIAPTLRQKVTLIAMCFPTTRDRITDRANAIFDEHVNLPTRNKTITVRRILEARPDFLLFSDMGLDCRVFALAHERMARHQAALWGWGATMGIPAIDYYFVPEIIWWRSKCPVSNSHHMVFPQELFTEQVVLLEGLPPVSKRDPLKPKFESWLLLQERFLLPPENQAHLYLLPAGARHFHPEMDAAIAVLLKTDPLAVVVLAVPMMGRDRLPALHVAVRHDMLHPTMPAAAVAKLRARLRPKLGDAISRVRVLPPMHEDLFRLLRSYSVAMLDPFPVGLHLPLLEGLLEGVPVVSAPRLQECTNSHIEGIASSLGIHLSEETFAWPATPEEYAVFAMRLQREYGLRSMFNPKANRVGFGNHGKQIISFAVSLVQEKHSDEIDQADSSVVS